MDWGKKNRLAQLLGADGKCFSCRSTMATSRDRRPTWSGLQRPSLRFTRITTPCSARAILRAMIDPVTSKPIILRVSGVRA